MSNDHLVSKTYLSWFEGGAMKKLYCSYYRKSGDNYHWSNAVEKDKSQVCYEKDRFFTDTERLFQIKFENDWNVLIDYLNKFNFSKFEGKHCKKNKIFNGQQVKQILDFIFIHYKRSKKVKEANKSHAAVCQNLALYEKSVGRKLSDEEVCEFNKLVDNSFVTIPQESSRYFKKLTWLLQVNGNSTPFITSSDPVVLHDNMPRECMGIYVPLSPQFAVLITYLKTKKKGGIKVEKIGEAGVKKLNKIMKNALVENYLHQPIIISNSKEALKVLIS